MVNVVSINPDNPIEPIVDPYSIGVGDMLDTSPPARRWLLDELLPLGVVGLLAAGGGTGKSFLTIQLAVAVATGLPFLGIDVNEPGGVLIVAAEDERDELHRRLKRVVDKIGAGDELDEGARELLRERLFIASRVGVDNRLTLESEREIVRSGMGDRIVALVEQLPPINLIVLDPVSRFRGGDENSNDAATRFIESVESIRAATGATLLLPHHCSKDGLRAGAEALTAECVRGASSLVDSVRWAAAMGVLRKDAAANYGIDKDDAGRYVRLDVVKNNYAPPWPGLWLERAIGGALVPTQIDASKTDRHEQRANERYRELLPKLKGLISERQENGEPLSKNALRDFGGAAGYFGVGDKTLRSIAERAIAEEQIFEHDRAAGRGKELRTW